MKKRILSILLVLCMVFAMIPAMSITASAASATAVYVGSTNVINGINITYWLNDSTGGIKSDGADETHYNVKYNPDGSTLTLKDVNITKAHDDGDIRSGIRANGDLTIELADGSTNTITGQDNIGKSSCGVSAYGSISIGGSGNLITTGGSANNSYGIYAYSDVLSGIGVSFSGTSVITAIGGSAASNSYGVSAKNYFLILGSSVTAKSTSATGTVQAINLAPSFLQPGYTLIASKNSSGIPNVVSSLDKIGSIGSYKYLRFIQIPVESTPTATFTATGADTGTLGNVTTAMKYSVNNGSSWTSITGTTMNITGVTTVSGINIYLPGNGNPPSSGTATADSAAQTINITEAATPNLTATQPAIIGGNGSIPMTAAHEYSSNSGSSWTSATGTTSLAPGTYLVRVKATGAVLASESQSITLTAYTPATEATPAATFAATGADTGTLGNVTTAMKYSVNNGSSWTSITGTTMNITGVTTASGVKVYLPGNGTTTTDSAVQSINITKATTPNLTATQPAIIGGNGSIPMTAAHEYSSNSGSSWASATSTASLAPGTYLVRVKATGTVLASDAQSLIIDAFTGTKEATPAATFTATGADTGTLGNVTTAMKYSVNNGSSWTSITGTTMDIADVTAASGIRVYQPGNGTTTTDSDVQSIVVTKAVTPSVGKTDCATLLNNDGKLTGITAAMEYKLSTASVWTGGSGSDITGLASGNYHVRVKATGTVLASDSQNLTISEFTGTQEATPSATFTATDADAGTLGNVTTAMKYSVDGGSTWTSITGTTMDIADVTAASGIKVYLPSNGTTTTDSDVQSITVTKAATPSADKTDCTTLLNNDGKLTGVTTAMEYKLSSDSDWIAGTGSDITDLACGTYNVRVKAAGTILASDSQNLTISAFSGTQEATPSATFTATGTDTGTLSDVEDGMKYQINSGSWMNIDGSADISLTELSPCVIKVVRKGNNTTTTDSMEQIINITAGPAVTGVSAEGCTTSSNNDGKLIGVAASMEWRPEASGWTAGTGSDITGLTSGNYEVRVKAGGHALAGSARPFVVAGYTEIPEDTPDADTDYISEILTGLTADGSYAVNSTDKIADGNGEIAIENNWFGTTIYLVKKGDGIYTINSDAQPINLTVRPAAAVCTAAQPSSGSATGTITGITTEMQYSTNGGGSWTDGTGSDVTGLAPGTVLIRVKATTNAPAGLDQTITITAYSAPPSGGGSSSGSATLDSGAPVIVDGKSVNIGKETKSGEGTTVTVDQSKLGDNMKGAVAGSSVVVPVGENGTATASLVVKNIEDMADKGMMLTVKTGNVAYNLKTAAIDTAALAAAFSGADMSKIPFDVTIKNSSASVEGETLVLSPVDFTVTATYNGKTVSVDTFSAYIDRVIEVTAEQATRITTAVVVNADGSTRHVPTKVIEQGGKYYAVINSCTNSTYALIQNEVTFTDATGKWYEAAANEMGSRKIIEGRSASVFDGNASITRAEFAAILVRALGLPAYGTSTFTDVSASAWYSGAVATAVQYGLVAGRDKNQFDPSSNITRQEAMAMLKRAATLTGFTGVSGNLDGFTDANSVGSWAQAATAWSIGSGLVQGADGKLNPTASITRAESASIILRLLQKAGLVDVRSEA